MVDPCHKKNGHICHLLEEENLVDNIIFEPHHLSGSLKEDRENLIVSMNNFLDTNTLVTRCCSKASIGELKEKHVWKNS